MNEELAVKLELDTLKKENIASVIFILTVLISIYLTYNEQQRLQKMPTSTTLKFDQNLNILNRIIGVGVLLFLLYLAIKDLEIAKLKNIETSIFEKQIVASVLNLIAGLIILRIVIEAIQEDTELGAFENPIT